MLLPPWALLTGIEVQATYDVQEEVVIDDDDVCLCKRGVPEHGAPKLRKRVENTPHYIPNKHPIFTDGLLLCLGGRL